MDSLDSVGLVLSILGLVVLVPVIVLFAEVVLGAFAVPRTKDEQNNARFAVLIPAHNEEQMIEDTTRHVMAQLTDEDRVIVVADNCTDTTADLAAALGATVVVRNDASRRGKGYALEFGVQMLRENPPEVVIVIDADCRPGEQSLKALAALAAAHQRPVQAYYEMLLPDAGVTIGMRIAAFAWRVKNRLRPLGMDRVGFPCQLMGSGMAFPWHIISNAKLGTSEIVEDLVLGLELASAGTPTLYAPNQRCFSWFPETSEGQDTQRTRWETGHVRAIVHHVPRMIGKAMYARNWQAVVLAVDAAVPPLSLLALIVTGFVMLTAGAAYCGVSETALWIGMVNFGLFAVSILIAWGRCGRDLISMGELCLAPVHALSKIALYGRIVAGRRVSWKRSSRDRR